MYYANHAAFDKKAQKILKTAMRYKVIKNEDEVNSILCSNLSADTNNCALCTNEAVILGRRKLGTLYFADVYNYSSITSATYLKGELSLVLGGGQTVDLKIAAEPDDSSAFVNYILSKNHSSISSGVSPADEIRKYKELLDMGAITDSEFDAKKKELLGL